MLADVVHAEDRRAALVGLDGGRDARGQRAGGRLGVAEDPAERALAGDADQHRPAEGDDLAEPPEELEVLLHGLAEAEARVEADPLLRDARVDGEPEPLLEEGGDVAGDVVVHGIELHRPRLSLHVHQAQVGLRGRDDAGQLRVAAKRGDIVHELRAELDRAAGDLGLGGVDRDRHLALKRLEDRHDAPQLLVERHALGAGPRRLAPDVHDRGAFVQHPSRGRDSILRLEVDSAVRERVGRDVDDAHHRRAGKSLLDRFHAERFAPTRHRADICGQAPEREVSHRE